MLKSYLIIERTALPDYFLKVVEARKLLENGVCDQVSEAVRRVGISRSTYYKYKDRIIEPSELNIGHKATLMLTLTHEAGNLSRVLNEVSAFGANILTITQLRREHPDHYPEPAAARHGQHHDLAGHQQDGTRHRAAHRRSPAP